MSSPEYPGTELELFADATTWKRYLRRQLRPYLHGRVLEVGAGLGGSTVVLHGPEVKDWVCLEPDRSLADRLAARIRKGDLPASCEVAVGTLETYAGGGFDTVLYLDVLEHIADDRRELERAAARVRPGGHVVALSPAHPWLYTPFDRAIGHHRRYTRASLRALMPPELRLLRLHYLDAAGLLASAGNRLLLRSARPTPRQIRFWDRVLVRLSTAIDPLLRYRVGKSVLAVWERPDPGSGGAGATGEELASATPRVPGTVPPGRAGLAVSPAQRKIAPSAPVASGAAGGETALQEGRRCKQTGAGSPSWKGAGHRSPSRGPRSGA